jgi:hypothetical protein
VGREGDHGLKREPLSGRCYAVDISDRFEREGGSWVRRLTFTYDGIDYPLLFEAVGVGSVEQAREKLFADGSTAAARKMFLTEVPLEVMH